MLVRHAQLFMVMRGEVDHQEASARRHQPSGFRQRRRGLGQEVQHAVHDHEIAGTVRQACVEDVAVADIDPVQTRFCKMVARDIQHLL